MTSVIIFLKLRVSQGCDRQKTKRTGPHYVLVESCTSPLTSLPMQRCCPTPFSHLWCRLILQALQRRPCFAVFPARNTTCLAVVPGNTQEENARMLRFSRVVVGGLGRPVNSKLRTKWQRTWKELVTIISPFAESFIQHEQEGTG